MCFINTFALSFQLCGSQFCCGEQALLRHTSSLFQAVCLFLRSFLTQSIWIKIFLFNEDSRAYGFINTNVFTSLLLEILWPGTNNSLPTIHKSIWVKPDRAVVTADKRTSDWLRRTDSTVKGARGLGSTMCRYASQWSENVETARNDGGQHHAKAIWIILQKLKNRNRCSISESHMWTENKNGFRTVWDFVKECWNAGILSKSAETSLCSMNAKYVSDVVLQTRKSSGCVFTFEHRRRCSSAEHRPLLVFAGKSWVGF